MPRTPRPATRSAAFFGLHYDFHCGQQDVRVGGRTTPAMVRAVLETVRPDHVQIDCKGHPGVSSYPTQAGIAAQGIVKDQLRVWRDVTRTAGVPLTMHYSGVWDEAAIKAHPAWAVIEADGKASPRATSVFAPYLDALMLPQLHELAGEYAVDAVWVDGDCWGVALDWSPWSLAVWQRTHPGAAMPTKPDDPAWQDFVDHCREGFRDYLRRYVDALHASHPGFEVASNWAFSSHMPEPVSAAVDFISGDFSSTQSVQSARLQARCLMGQGKPWDLMAWGFGYHFDGPKAEKSALQLCQEAALVLSLGGGFQIYTNQHRDASIGLARLPILAEVARFCRKRQDLCHRAAPVGDVAVLYSHEDWRRRSGAAFAGGLPSLSQVEGALRLCLDARHHTEIVLDHQLAERLDGLRTVVLPECQHLAEATRELLLAWLHRGGRILALGPHAVAALGLAGLPFTADGKIAEAVSYLRDSGMTGGAEFAAQKGDWQPWKAKRGATVLTTTAADVDPAAKSWPAAVACRIGRGHLVAVAVEVARSYLDRTSSVSCALVAAWLKHLDPKPLVEVEGPGRVEVALMRKDGELRINLTNLEGPHDARQVLAWDHIPPVGPLTVRIRTPARSVRWEPDGVRLKLKRTRDGVMVTVPGVAIHGVLCVR